MEKNNIEKIREALEYFLNRGYIDVYIGEHFNETIIHLKDEKLIELRKSLPALESIQKRLEAADLMEGALDKWYHEKYDFDSQSLSDFYFEFEKSYKEARGK